MMKTCRGCGNDCGERLIGNFWFCSDCLGDMAETLFEIRECQGDINRDNPCETYCDQGCSYTTLENIKKYVDYDIDSVDETQHKTAIEEIKEVIETYDEEDREKCTNCTYEKICRLIDGE